MNNATEARPSHQPLPWRRLAAVAIAVLVTATACSSNPADPTDPTDATDASPPGDTACPAPAPGETSLTLTVDGVERTAVAYVPEGAESGAPLLLALHGSNNTAELLLTISELRATADAEGFVLVAPNGSVPGGDEGTFAWNVPGVTDAPEGTPDDIDFVEGLVDELGTRLCVDTDRVFATGYSGGGRMISAIACERPGLLTAIAPVVGLRAGVPVEQDGEGVPDASTCEPAEGTPVITFTGADDPINPAEGGGAPYWQYGAEAALERWAEINGCEPEPQTSSVADGVTLREFTGCDDGAALVSYELEGVGHVWPGGNQELHEQYASVLGTPTDAIDANALMWEFFAAQG